MNATVELKTQARIIDQIKQLKLQTDTVILAHYYQDEDVQSVADYIGDSLDLARKAQQVQQQRILFAGVHFMAETAKILNPSKKVLIPDLDAGCSLADSCFAEDFAAFKQEYPEHVVLTYINCSAEIKAMSDIIVTSSNAVDIVNSVPIDQKIIFAPDRYLGAWVMKQTGRDMVLWDGSCRVHERFSIEKMVQAKADNPGSKIVAHPECTEDLLIRADFVGSTRKILDFVVNDPAEVFVVVTEPGIITQMKKDALGKQFIAAMSDDESCHCNVCPYMRLNTIEKIHNVLLTGQPEINMEESVRVAAERSLQAMLDRS